MFIHQKAYNFGIYQKGKVGEGNLNFLHLENQKKIKCPPPKIKATWVGSSTPGGWLVQEGTGTLGQRGEHDDLLFHLCFSCPITGNS